MAPSSSSAQSPAPSIQAFSLRRHGRKLALSVLIGALFWMVLRGGGLPVFPSAQALGAVPWWAWGGYALLLIPWSCVRAARTRHLVRPLQPVSLRQILSISFIGFVSIFVLPFRLGEIVRPALMHQRKVIPFATATGVFGAERILDGVFLMTILGICLPLGQPLSPLPNHIGKLPIPVVAVPAAAYTTLLVFIGAVFAMTLFYWRRVWARRVLTRWLGAVSQRAATVLADQLEKLSDGFRFLPSARHLSAFLLETGLYWGIGALGMWLLARGCGISQITFVQACTLMGVLGLGIIVPGAPGYFGAFQASIYAGLALYFPEQIVTGPGSTYVFFLYLIQLSMMFVHALVGALLDRGQQALHSRLAQDPSADLVQEAQP